MLAGYGASDRRNDSAGFSNGNTTSLITTLPVPHGIGLNTAWIHQPIYFFQMISLAPYSAPERCKVYTPRNLADGIVRAVGDQQGATWLEPSFGHGVFIEAIRSIGVERRRVTAVVLDTTVSLADRLAVTHRGVDFLKWAG